METFDAIRTALAVRHFKDTPIPEPIVRQIVEAGRLTASGGNRQPWHFIVVRDKETLRRLGQLAPTGPYRPAGGQPPFGHSRGGLGPRDPSVRLPG